MKKILMTITLLAILSLANVASASEIQVQSQHAINGNTTQAVHMAKRGAYQNAVRTLAEQYNTKNIKYKTISEQIIEQDNVKYYQVIIAKR